eukprot:865763-Heterocapsa_arctica.AAC.1
MLLALVVRASGSEPEGPWIETPETSRGLGDPSSSPSPSPPLGAPAPTLTVRKWAPAMEHQSNPGETCSWTLQEDP